MEQNRRDWRWLRAVGALALGLLILAATLPGTGRLAGGPSPTLPMWRFGPFLFFPGPFFGVVGTVTALTGCTVFGIMRRNSCEFIGWVLLGLVFIGMFFS